MQALINPLLAEARIFPLGQYAAMTYEQTVERIAAEAKAQKKSQTDLAKVAGLPSQSAMSNVLKGKRKLSIEEARRLEDFLGIETEPQVRWVPLIGLASAGAWREATQVPRSEFPIPRRAAGNRAFAVEIVGDSMNMLLPEGGWAVIDPEQRSLFTGRVYLIQNGDHEVTVKRYCGDPARFEPVSTNPTHLPLVLEGIPYDVIGRVVSYGNTGGL